METIPISASAKEALYLPLGYFRQFFRFAFVPMLIVLAAQILGGVLAAVSGRKVFYGLWWLAYGIVAVPFSVSWTRLAVLGVDSNVDRSWFTFGVREFKYLSTSLVIALLLCGPPGTCLYIAYSMNWAALPLVLGLVLLLVEVAIGLRFTFLLPAIALDSYRGLEAVWKQTRSVVLRIMAVIFLSGLPINCGTAILHQIESASANQPSLLLVLGTADILLLFLSGAVTAGAIAVSYRFRTEREAAAEVLK